MTVFTEGFHAGEHLVSEANGYHSREAVIITGADLDAGTVLGRKTGALTAAAAAVAGNSGAATITAAPPVAAGTNAGTYEIVMLAAGPTADFEMEDPDGVVVGTGNVGTAATLGGIGPFTITDAGTDPAVGDRFRIVVTEDATGAKYAKLNLAATDGSQHAAGVLYDRALAASADVKATAHVRSCDVNGLALTWPAGITDSQKAAAIAELAALKIIVRN